MPFAQVGHLFAQVGHQCTYSGGSCFAVVGCMADQRDNETALEISQRMAQRRCAKYRALSHFDAVGVRSVLREASQCVGSSHSL